MHKVFGAPVAQYWLSDNLILMLNPCMCLCEYVFYFRHLEKMKKCYLVSSGDYYLSAEVLSKFKLSDGAQWTGEHLKNIQCEVLKPLLLYW